MAPGHSLLRFGEWQNGPPFHGWPITQEKSLSCQPPDWVWGSWELWVSMSCIVIFFLCNCWAYLVDEASTPLDTHSISHTVKNVLLAPLSTSPSVSLQFLLICIRNLLWFLMLCTVYLLGIGSICFDCSYSQCHTQRAWDLLSYSLFTSFEVKYWSKVF